MERNVAILRRFFFVKGRGVRPQSGSDPPLTPFLQENAMVKDNAALSHGIYSTVPMSWSHGYK